MMLGEVSGSNRYGDHAPITPAEALVQQLRRKTKEEVGEAFIFSGRVLGKVAFPLRRYIRTIGEQTYVDIDETSRQRLVAVADKKSPVIVASNHRSVDVDLYPVAHYRSAMSVDSFILTQVCEKYGIPLHILAQHNRYYDHPELWRRVKAKIGDKVREGLYAELGYIPVHTSQRHEERPEGTVAVPYATKPLKVAKRIQELAREGHSLGFFLYYGLTDDTEVPDRLRPGAVYYGAQLGLDILPVFIKNAKHMDPAKTLPPDHVVLRVGEPMKVEKLSKDKRIRRQQMEGALGELHEQINSLRRDAFTAQPV